MALILGLEYSDAEVDALRGLPSSEALVIHELKRCFAIAPVGIGHGDHSGSNPLGEGSIPSSPAFTDPEEIPFGPPPRLKPSQSIIELSWTWDKHRVCKTKKLANRKIRAWKRWYQRLGWRIYPGEDGCIANHPDGSRHAITLRVWPKPVVF